MLLQKNKKYKLLFSLILMITTGSIFAIQDGFEVLERKTYNISSSIIQKICAKKNIKLYKKTRKTSRFNRKKRNKKKQRKIIVERGHYPFIGPNQCADDFEAFTIVVIRDKVSNKIILEMKDREIAEQTLYLIPSIELIEKKGKLYMFMYYCQLFIVPQCGGGFIPIAKCKLDLLTGDICDKEEIEVDEKEIAQICC